MQPGRLPGTASVFHSARRRTRNPHSARGDSGDVINKADQFWGMAPTLCSHPPRPYCTPMKVKILPLPPFSPVPHDIGCSCGSLHKLPTSWCQARGHAAAGNSWAHRDPFKIKLPYRGNEFWDYPFLENSVPVHI